MAIKAHPVPKGLKPYARLVDACHNLGYVVELDWTATGWRLFVSESLDKDPLVNVAVAEKPPVVFNRLATMAVHRLGV